MPGNATMQVIPSNSGASRSSGAGIDGASPIWFMTDGGDGDPGQEDADPAEHPAMSFQRGRRPTIPSGTEKWWEERIWDRCQTN